VHEVPGQGVLPSGTILKLKAKIYFNDKVATIAIGYGIDGSADALGIPHDCVHPPSPEEIAGGPCPFIRLMARPLGGGAGANYRVSFGDATDEHNNATVPATGDSLEIRFTLTEDMCLGTADGDFDFLVNDSSIYTLSSNLVLPCPCFNMGVTHSRNAAGSLVAEWDDFQFEIIPP